MALNEDVKKEVTSKMEEYEERIDHFYLDSVGKVTVGVGHLLANQDAVSAVTLYTASNQIATLQAKKTEYDNIAKQEKGYKATWYKQFTKLVMKKDGIDALRDSDIVSFYGDLTNIYKKASGYPADFDSMHRNVQRALFDMIFNLGAYKIVHVFKNFDRAIRVGNWKTAAVESNRPQVSDARNKYVRELFLSVG